MGLLMGNIVPYVCKCRGYWIIGGERV